MPISKDGNGTIVATPMDRKDIFDQSGVVHATQFAVCDTDVLKQMKFDPSAQATNTSVTIKSGANTGNIVLTLPSTSGSIGGGNSFATMQTPAGTSPVATSPTDTLTFASADSSVTITGNATTDTINLAVASSPTATNATNSTNSTNVATTSTSSNASFYPLFVASTTNSNQAASLNSGVSLNPSTATLTASTFSGALAGVVLGDFGTASLGNVVSSSGTTTLIDDAHYGNLTLSGTGVLAANGYRIFVNGNLDISAAPAGAIVNNGNVGGTGNQFGTGGSLGAATTAGTIGIGGAGVAGGAGGSAGTTSGAASSSPTVGGSVNGGSTTTAGRGSITTGSGYNSANGHAGATAVNSVSFSRYATDLLRGATVVEGGLGGPGGSGASYDNSGTNCPGGGGGASGGGVIAIYARTIIKGTNSTAGIIQAIGGKGGQGGAAGNNNQGGGGGGSGGGGGWIYIAYGSMTGSTITNALDVSGGAGGDGGLGIGTVTANIGGGSGDGGRVTLVNLAARTSTETKGGTGSVGNTGSGATGGTGASINTSQVSL